MTVLLKLLPSDLRALASGLRIGRLCPPYPPFNVERVLNRTVANEVSSELQRLAETAMPPIGIATTLEMLALAYENRPPLEDVVELVTTGAGHRTTAVVVEELFRSAQKSVLVAGYSVYQGQKVFAALADRMRDVPELDVRLFLDIQRKPGNTSSSVELVREFAHRFRTTQWPKDRPIPRVYYDPRSLESELGKTAALHAKCVVMDGFDLFISSANFTEAAQQRNIEIGVRLRSAELAGRVVGLFSRMQQESRFRLIDG